jgi:guanylate kinase
VVAAAVARYPEIWLPVPVTTRQARPGEVDGHDYHFIGDEAFGRMVRHGELLEWGRFAGTGYGTPRAPVTERVAAGVPALLAVGVEGARQVRREFPGALLVFLARPAGPPGAGRDPGGWRARGGIEAGREFDITLVNSRVEDAGEQLVSLATA